MGRKRKISIIALQKAVEVAWKRYSKASRVVDTRTMRCTSEECKQEKETEASLIKAIGDWQRAKHDLCSECDGLCVDYGHGSPCVLCGGTGKRSKKWRWKERLDGDPSSPDPWWKPCAVCDRNTMLWDRSQQMNALLPKRLREAHLCAICFREAVGAKDPRDYRP